MSDLPFTPRQIHLNKDHRKGIILYQQAISEQKNKNLSRICMFFRIKSRKYWLMHICSLLSEEECHHPGQFWFGTWNCCEKRDRTARGCQKGRLFHHSDSYKDEIYYDAHYGHTYDLGDMYLWSCCGQEAREARGCREGAHPDPFS